MTFADNFNIRNSQLSGNNLASALDALLATYQSDVNTGVINTASTSYVDYTGASLSISSASGQILVIYADIALSHGTDQGLITAAINYDASNVLERYCTASGSGTGGTRDTLSLFHVVAAPSVGAHTIKLQWKVGSGTGYSSAANIYAFCLQNT